MRKRLRSSEERALKRGLDELQDTLNYLLEGRPRAREAQRQRYLAVHREWRQRIARAYRERSK